MDIFDQIQGGKVIAKKEKDPLKKKKKSSKTKKSKKDKNPEENLPSVESILEKITDKVEEVEIKEAVEDKPEEPRTATPASPVEEPKEKDQWADEEDDESAAAGPAIHTSTVSVQDMNKEDTGNKISKFEKSRGDWKKFANAPSPVPVEDEEEEVKKPVVEEKPAARSGRFVPAALRGPPGSGSSLNPMMGGPRGAGMGYGGRRKPQYNMDDQSAFPTLGNAVNDRQPEGFTSVQRTERTHGQSGGGNSALSTSNKFGGLCHD